MIAVLKVGSSNELVLLDGNKVYSAFSLNRSSILSDAYKYLKNVSNLSEFRVIMTFQLIGGNLKVDGIPLEQINCGGVNKVFYISKQDIDKLKVLTANLGLEYFKLYNMFDFLKMISKRRSAIVSGKYLDRYVYVTYVSKGEIKDFRENQVVDKNDFLDIQRFADTDYKISEFNNELDSIVQSQYTNIQTMNDEELSRLYMNLLTEFVTPVRIIKIKDKEVQASDIVELNGTIAQPKLPPKLKVEEKPKKKISGYSDHVLSNYVLDGVGCLAAVLVSFSLFGNIQIPNNVQVLEEKEMQLGSVVKSMENNLAVLESYSKSVQTSENSDPQLYQRISNIKIDGIFQEFSTSGNDVGLVVYLTASNEQEAKAAINAYTKALEPIINIDEVKEDAGYSVEGSSLVKFIIQGSKK